MLLVAHMVDMNLAFMNCFIYNLIIMMQKSILKSKQTPIINPVICLEN